MKRFYKDVSVAQEGDGWRVLLDGRAIKTPGGSPQLVQSKELADLLASEWSAQGDEIDTSLFANRDLADYAIDVVAAGREPLIDELAAYAETDTLCYRADPDEPLFKRQMEVWEPLLGDAEARWDIRFDRISGIIHRPQPVETIERIKTVIGEENEFRLAALRMLTSLSASLVVGLLALADDADPEALWNAANLEEDWQAQLWGRDAEAERSRQIRFDAFAMAARFAALAQDR